MIYCLTVTPSYAVSTGPLLNLAKSPFLCQLVDSGWKLVDDVWCNRCSLYSGSLVSRCGTALLRQTAYKILHMMAESWFSTLLQHADARASWLRKGALSQSVRTDGICTWRIQFFGRVFPNRDPWGFATEQSMLFEDTKLRSTKEAAKKHGNGGFFQFTLCSNCGTGRISIAGVINLEITLADI